MFLSQMMVNVCGYRLELLISSCNIKYALMHQVSAKAILILFFPGVKKKHYLWLQILAYLKQLKPGKATIWKC